MLGVENYNSDDEGGSDSEHMPSQSSFPLTSSQPSSTSSRTPAYSSSIRKRPVKIAVELPQLINVKTDEADDDMRAPKRRRTERSGKSSLLSLLPAPKGTVILSIPKQDRILGGGVLPAPTISSNYITNPPDTDDQNSGLDNSGHIPSTSLVDITKDEPHKTLSIDFFSLGTPKVPTALRLGASNPLPQSLSIVSAPSVSDQSPPEPTAEDPYPGYYKLPSGQWGRYDPEYYQKFWEAKQQGWNSSYEIQDKGFEHANEEALEISATDQLDHAKKLREEKKALTKNATDYPEKPNMNIAAPKIGSRARYRHQLSALLTEAYDKREELEEKIAQARRNRKEAGNKYGF